MLPALIETIQSQAPGIKMIGFALPDEQEIGSILESGQLDVVLTNYEPAGKNVRSQRISEEQFATLVRPGKSGAAGALTLEEFIDTPHVVFQERSSTVDDALQAIGRRRVIGAIAQNFFSMPAIAAKSGFICSLPERSAAICAKSHNLNVYTPPLHLAPWPLFVGWHSKFNSDPSIHWLIEKVRNVALSIETIDVPCRD
jgi:DNA-binding transcriptional LysR family regulator